jgi:uncharacterized protein
VTLLQPQPAGSIPVPSPTATSKSYWEGCARQELLYQRCNHCDAPIHSPAVVCGRCWSTELRWKRSAGAGSVYSWTVVWRPPSPTMSVPYAPIIVDLDEGWQLLSCLVGCQHEEVREGMRVRVEFHPAGQETWLPYFRPEGD